MMFVFQIGEPLGTCETLLEVGAKLEHQSAQRGPQRFFDHRRGLKRSQNIH